MGCPPPLFPRGFPHFRLIHPHFSSFQDRIKLAHLLQEAASLLALSSVTPQTAKRYGSQQNLYLGFCKTLGFLAVPADSTTLSSFIAYLKLGRAVSASTIRGYLAAVRHLHIINNFPDPSADKPKLALVRSAATKGGSVAPSRVPITFDTLLAMHNQALSSPSFSSTLLTACCFTAFFGFLRVSEFASAEKANSKPGLKPAHVSFSQQWVQLLLLDTKTDKSKRGVRVTIAKRPLPPCPVKWLAEYCRIRPLTPDSSPLFVHNDGSPMSQTWFRGALKDLCSSLGLSGNVNTHSLRIGAATDAAASGMSDFEIQRLGRWRSQAFMVYVKPSPSRQAKLNLKFSMPLSFQEQPDDEQERLPLAGCAGLGQ